MKEEIRRIMRLVQEGKLSPEDAAELIDAFQAQETGRKEGDGEPQVSGSATEPPEPPEPPKPPGAKDPFQGLVDMLEEFGRDATRTVNWQEVANQIRTETRRGLEAVKSAVSEAKSGKWNIPWFGTYEVREVTLPLRVAEGKVLRVENPCGDVKIVGGFTEGSAKASARVRGADPEEARAKASSYTLMIEESEHMVLIRQPDVGGLDVDLDIQVAGAAVIEVRSMSGSVTVLNTGAGARVETASGDTTLRGLNGPIEVRQQSGDIHIEGCTTPGLTAESKSGDVTLVHVRGNLNVRSASGDVELEACAGKTIAVESVSGDATIDLAEPVTGTLNVRTVSGSSSVEIPDGSDCRVSLSTLRGSVECDLPLQDEAKTEQHITGRLGAGAGSLDVSAVSGDVNVTLRSGS